MTRPNVSGLSPRENSYRIGRRVALGSLTVSVLLACMNVAVGLVTGSTSVLATGFEFAGDVLASSVVLAGLVLAERPADQNHPYGHGRFETLAAFAVGIILAAGGGAISFHSLQAIGAIHAPPGAAAAGAMVVAIVARSVMSLVKFRVGRRIQSTSLAADAWNDVVDILSAMAALTAVALANYNPARFLAADHYGGFVVGVIVIAVGIRVVRDASMELMDTMPGPELTDEIRRVARAVPGVRRVEKGFARKTGLQYHVDLHVQVDPLLTVAASHEIAGRVRATVRAELPWVADVLVHVEPAQGTEPRGGTSAVADD
jgi:cation diffusion facilitator family transporter